MKLYAIGTCYFIIDAIPGPGVSGAGKGYIFSWRFGSTGNDIRGAGEQAHIEGFRGTYAE